MTGESTKILYPQEKTHYIPYRGLYQNNIISSTCEVGIT